MSFPNMFIEFEDENNDPYYHENRNNDNMNQDDNYENTYNVHENNTTNMYNIYDNNNLEIMDNNFNMTLRNLISFITNNTFMFNNNTNMSVDHYIEEQELDDNITIEISSSSSEDL